ncbi:MAG: OsmC family protein [Candidatus Competibacteraceae bacterium]|nr:OsmC family protein [Candidatus Competibacteraceae bacterium]
MHNEHYYTVEIQWTGNSGDGTHSYESYQRSHTISKSGAEDIHATADPAFRGDKQKFNPEELFIASLSGCHMLWYLHLCSDHGIVVNSYADAPVGIMIVKEDGSGKIEKVTLRPKVCIQLSEQKNLAVLLHQVSHQKCFIANSINCPIDIEPSIYTEE